MPIPLDLWGQRGYPNVDLAAEPRYFTAIRSLLGNDFTPDGAEITATAMLKPEPGNRHDRTAVGVWISGGMVGHLPRDKAIRYAPILTHLTSRGWAPQVRARVWGAEPDGRAFRGSVRLDLAEPHLLVPANPPPTTEHRLLPHGNPIQVTGEETHVDTLIPFLRPEGECWAYATLHEIVDQRAVVEVRLDGTPVGHLTPRTSRDVLPTIHHLTGQGLTTAARALVKGNRERAEVFLHAVRAHQLPPGWLGPKPTRPDPPRQHAPIPPPPTGIRFTPPPEWPQPPKGWKPPRGWHPDPAWPPAPEGWQWWTPTWN